MTTNPPEESGGRVLYALRGVSKTYGATRALRDCSIEIRSHEIHALVGENGSGKSTLVKIMSGIVAPDRGVIQVPDGTERARFKTPSSAASEGVFTVFQETLVAEHLSVSDNIWMGHSGALRWRLPIAQQRERSRSTLAELTANPPDVDQIVSGLPLARRQLTVIARALVRDPRLLILDESTSALDVADRERLFELLRRRRNSGHATLFISHRMDELSALADRVTVLRAGASVATLAMSDTSTSEVLNLAAGRDLAAARVRTPETPGTTRVRAQGVKMTPEAEPFDFTLKAGELVGVAGLEGHGQDLFIQALAGLFNPLAGDVLGGGGQPITSLRSASRQGIAYVPRDRKAEGAFEPLSILENFSMPTRNRYSRAGWLSNRAQVAAFNHYSGPLKVKFGSLRDPITSLSGGNQQKVIISRWLAANPIVVLLNDPTRGVDQATKQDIYGLIDQLCAGGAAVVMLATEVEELIGLADRVLVFHEGSPFAELSHQESSRSTIVSAMFGQDSGGQE